MSISSEPGAMSAATAPRPVPGAALQTVPLRHPWRVVSAVVMGLVLLALVYVLTTNERFQWDVVRRYLTFDQILSGLGRTLVLTAGAMVIGILGGILLAVMRLSANPLVAWSSSAYVWFFRGTPVLVQLIFWFNLSALFPTVGLSVPWGPSIFAFDANDLITVYVAALLGLGLNEAAYMSEIVRSGINSVDEGQAEAAHALGMSGFLTFRRVVLPQAMRIIVPPTGNQVIGMLKTTSLVSVIALPDLLYSAQLIYNRNFDPIPLLIVASLWYLLLTTLLSVVQHYIEKHYNRGVRSSSRSVKGERFTVPSGPSAVADVPGSGVPGGEQR